MAVSIDLDSIFNLVATQMNKAWETLGIDGELFICTEQDFVKKKDISENAVYVVLKFGEASVDIGQVVLDSEITALSQGNKINTIRSLLLTYALSYNLKRLSGITQVYSTATQTSDFNEVAGTYRSVYSMKCTFIVGVGMNYIESISYDGNSVPFLNAEWNTNEDLKPQPRYDTGRTESENQFTTHTFSIVSYPLTNVAFFMDAHSASISTTPALHNRSFSLTITWTNGTSYTGAFKVASYKNTQKIAEVPSITITLSE